MDQMVPILRRKRWHPECFASGVQPIPARRVHCVPVGFLQIHDPRFVINDHAWSAWVIPIDVVNSVARIEAVIGRYWGTDIGDARRPTTINFIVKDFVFVEVSVAEKLSSNGGLIPTSGKVWGWNNQHTYGFVSSSPIHDAVVIVWPHFEAIAMARRDMPKNVNFFTFQLGTLKLVD